MLIFVFYSNPRLFQYRYWGLRNLHCNEKAYYLGSRATLDRALLLNSPTNRIVVIADNENLLKIFSKNQRNEYVPYQVTA